MSRPVDRIRSSFDPHSLELLFTGLAPTDLQTLMLYVYDRRAADQTPSKILDRHLNDRFVRPSPVNARSVLDFDRIAYETASAFDAIELAPLCPLGTVSALGSVNQNNVVSTSRNSEVVADSTNVMAIECAARRKAGAETVRLCASHRVTRAQFIDQPNSWAHFRLFAMCTAGRDTGSFQFESEAFVEHLSVYVRLIHALGESGYAFGKVHIRLTDFSGQRREALGAIQQNLKETFPDVEVDFYPDRETGRGYYSPIAFHLYVHGTDGEVYFLADGGFTDWTAKLGQNKKERLLISGIGSERMISLFAPTISR